MITGRSIACLLFPPSHQREQEALQLKETFMKSKIGLDEAIALINGENR